MTNALDEVYNGDPYVTQDTLDELETNAAEVENGLEQAPTKQPTSSPETESSTEDKNFIQGVGEEFSKTKPSLPHYVGAAGAGVIDFGIGLKI